MLTQWAFIVLAHLLYRKCTFEVDLNRFQLDVPLWTCGLMDASGLFLWKHSLMSDQIGQIVRYMLTLELGGYLCWDKVF